MFEPLEPPAPEDVRDLRAKLGLTQVEMADFCGLKLSHYRNIERGRHCAGPLLSRVLCWIEGGFIPPEFVALGLHRSLEG